MTYKIEIEHLDGTWHEAGKLASFVDGRWVFPRFETVGDAVAVIDREYADVMDGSKRVVPTSPKGVTTMNNSLRTVAEIEASIAFVKAAIAKSDSYMDALQSAIGDEIALEWFVVGFDNGLFVNFSGTLGGALWAYLHPSRERAERKLVRNGAGDWAKVMTYGQALRRQLELQADVHDDLRIMLYDLGGELADAQADAEWLEMEAAKEAYEREHRRHGSWSLRSAAAYIANSQTEYEG